MVFGLWGLEKAKLQFKNRSVPSSPLWQSSNARQARDQALCLCFPFSALPHLCASQGQTQTYWPIPESAARHGELKQQSFAVINVSCPLLWWKKTIHSLYWQTKNHNSVPVVATDSLAQNVRIFCNFSCNKLMPKNKQTDLVKVCDPKGIP